MRKHENNGKSADSIRGSLNPIKDSDIEAAYNMIIRSRGFADLDLFESFREMVKDTIAIYNNHATKRSRQRITISDESRNIINAKLINHTNPHVSGFVDCTIAYYDSIFPHVLSINTDCPECNAGKEKSAYAQARENSNKIVKSRVKKIIEKINKRNWDNIPPEVLQQYNAIEDAVKFFCTYIQKMHMGTLPKEISDHVYSSAFNKDVRIKDHYCYVPGLNIHKLKTKENNNYTSVNQEAATVVFCGTYVF